MSKSLLGSTSFKLGCNFQYDKSWARSYSDTDTFYSSKKIWQVVFLTSPQDTVKPAISV